MIGRRRQERQKGSGRERMDSESERVMRSGDPNDACYMQGRIILFALPTHTTCLLALDTSQQIRAGGLRALSRNHSRTLSNAGGILNLEPTQAVCCHWAFLYATAPTPELPATTELTYPSPFPQHLLDTFRS